MLVHERKRLPDDRNEIGRKFRVGDYEGYIHVGVYDDGSPGDIFVDIAKDGTTLQGLMNSLMIAVSMGLQYGVPPEVYVSKLSHLRFEPSGMTNDADIRVAKSIVDYIFRWFGKKFLTAEQQEEVGILSPEVKAMLAERYANGGERRRRPIRSRRRRPARRRSSTRGRTPSSAPAAAAAWCARARATRAATAARTPAARSLTAASTDAAKAWRTSPSAPFGRGAPHRRCLELIRSFTGPGRPSLLRRFAPGDRAI